MRRSVIASQDLCAGTIISKKDLILKRPGSGIPADKVESLVGKKLLNDISFDTLIHYTDLE